MGTLFYFIDFDYIPRILNGQVHMLAKVCYSTRHDIGRKRASAILNIWGLIWCCSILVVFLLFWWIYAYLPKKIPFLCSTYREFISNDIVQSSIRMLLGANDIILSYKLYSSKAWLDLGWMKWIGSAGRTLIKLNEPTESIKGPVKFARVTHSMPFSASPYRYVEP